MTRTLTVLFLFLLGCADPAADHGHGGDDHDHGDGGHDHAETRWAVTAWGDRFEVFAETDLLLLGNPAESLIHVTRLDGYAPLAEGTVSVLLRDEEDSFLAATETRPRTPGIYATTLDLVSAGVFDLVFRIETPDGSEDVAAGRVRVGEFEGRGLEGHEEAEGEVSFLKEQQWSVEFATAWADVDSLRSTVRGPARVRARAGADVLITAPVDGRLLPGDWPYPGLAVEAAAHLFHLVPAVGEDRSLAMLEASAADLRSELGTALARRDRLDDLLEVSAVSEAEVEAAHARVVSLEARLAAAERDLAMARAGRGGDGTSGDAMTVRAPFAGVVAEVPATAGQVVRAGQPLARVVQSDPVWLDVSLRPADVVSGDMESVTLFVTGPGLDEGIRFGEAGVRFVSRSPVVDRSTGRVSVLFEVTGSAGRLVPGTVVTAEVGRHAERAGVIVPASALVDDGGVPVVYEQAGGEGFDRREIRVLGRDGDLYLVAGIEPGSRVVTRGGASIRRTTLLSTGGGHGHVH